MIRGPIANDTLYDTWGVITSGLLKKSEALRLFLIGPCYTQIVLKTERAVSALKFLGAEEISEEEVRLYRKMVREEEKVFQEEFLEMLEEIMEGERR